MNISICVPPRDEQDAIIAALQKETSPLRATIDYAYREIALLREYRTRLISDVVTGKLDVRCVTLPAAEDVQIQGEWNGTFDAESDLTVDQELPELAQEAGD